MNYKLYLPIVHHNPLPALPPPQQLEIVDIVNDLPKHAYLKYSVRPYSWIKGLAIHHVAAWSNPWNVAAYHISPRPSAPDGWPGIGYHIYIMEDGVVYKTNLWETISYHVGNPNWKSLGIVLNGNFMTQVPTDAQIESGNLVCNYFYSYPHFSITEVHGHGWYPGGTPTACPGATHPQWFSDMVAVR